MQRHTNSDFKPSAFEHNDPKKFGYFLETLGYRSVKRQIESFMPQASSGIGDEFYDTAEDDPVDDPSLGIRDYELAEIGQVIVQTQDKMTASARQAAKNASVSEAAKQDVVGEAPKDDK